MQTGITRPAFLIRLDKSLEGSAPPLLRPLPARGIARRYARLVRPVLALDAFIISRKRGALLHMTTPVGAHEVMRVRARPARTAETDPSPALLHTLRQRSENRQLRGDLQLQASRDSRALGLRQRARQIARC